MQNFVSLSRRHHSDEFTPNVRRRDPDYDADWLCVCRTNTLSRLRTAATATERDIKFNNYDGNPDDH